MLFGNSVCPSVRPSGDRSVRRPDDLENGSNDFDETLHVVSTWDPMNNGTHAISPKIRGAEKKIFEILKISNFLKFVVSTRVG